MNSAKFAWAGVLVWASSAAAAVAQEGAAESQDRLLARRAAEADAYRTLATTIDGLQITSDTFVRQFVTESDVIGGALDAFITGVRLGLPTYHADGRCEVPAEVDVAQLISELKGIHTRHYRGDRIRVGDFENMRRYYRKDVISVIGQGVARPDLPPDLPAGVAQMLGPDVPASEARPKLPAIWEAVPPQERLMTVRSARLDAQRRLLERILGLRLTVDTLVRDFVTESDEIRADARGIVVGAREKGPPYYHDDELVVEVTMEVPIESVITTIRELHIKHYKGDPVRITDIERLRESARAQMLEATGSGVPNPQVVAAVAQQAGILMPDWSTRPIEAVGECTDPAIDTPQGKLKAVRCAELDARRKLSERVGGLSIEPNTLVRDFVAPFAEINARLQNAIVGAVVDKIELAGNTARVTVIVLGADIWSVVHDEWRVNQRTR